MISASGAVSYNNTTGVISLTSGNLTEATSSVLTITGGTGAVLGSGTSIQVKQASTTVSGFLSSTDWNTFNGKANALSGTTNYVAKFTSSSAIGNSIIFDNATGLGINTSSPFGSSAERTIHLTDASGGFATIYVTNAANTVKTILGMQSSNAIGVVGMQSNNPFVIVTNDIERMRITSAGNVLIGTTTSNNHKLEIVSGSTSAIRVSVDSGTNGISMSPGALFQIDKPGVGGGAFQITSGGNVLINTTTNNGERLYVDGAIRATGTITANSDLTLKKNLLKIENALEKVEQINGYTYEFKEDDSKRHAGVIAQEIQTVLPEIVNKGNDGILGVEYGNISALLIEAIKEQNTKIKNLETLLASK